MPDDRHLNWEGSFNVRDLGGLETIDGRRTKPGAAVRSGSLHKLTKKGWRALEAYGIRTVIDLRSTGEREAESYIPPSPEITSVHLPIEAENTPEDIEFWQHWRAFNCSPLYYTAFIKQYPDRIGETIRALTNAAPGGVLFHCGIGRDRTGLIALIFLNLLQAKHQDIVQDFTMSTERLRPHWQSIGRRNDETKVQELLERKETSQAETIIETLQALDNSSCALITIEHIALEKLRQRYLD